MDAMTMPSSMMSLADKEQMVASFGLAGNPDLLTSTKRNIFAFGGTVKPDEDKMKSIAERAREEVLDCKLEMWNFEWNVLSFFQERTRLHNENINFKNSHPWTDQEITDIKKAGLMPYQSPSEHRYMLTLMGEERGMETKFKSFGKDPTSQEHAEAVNYFFDWSTKTTRWERSKGKIFEDGAIGGMGVSMVGMDIYDPQGSPMMKRVRAQECMFDPVGAENGSLEGSKYFWRGRYIDAEDLIWMYPLFEKEINEFDFVAYSRSHIFDFTLANPKVRSTSGAMNIPFRYQNSKFRHPRKRVWVREFYRKGIKHCFAVYDSVANVDHIFDTVQHATYFYKILVEAYRYGIGASGGDSTTTVVDAPRPFAQQIVDQLVFAGDALIHIETFTGDRFPYHTFIPEFSDGEICGFFEHDKDNARMKNRMMIYLDLLLSGVKPKTFYDLDVVEQSGLTAGEFEKALTLPTKAIGLRGLRKQNIAEIIHSHDQPNLGQIPAILERAASASQNQLLGGMESLGQAGYSGESGAAIQHLQGAAGGALVTLFKEWEYFQIENGEALLMTMPQMSLTRVMATYDPRTREKYASFASMGCDSLHNMEFGLNIEEVSASPNDRKAQLNLLMSLLQNNPQMLQYAFEEIAELQGVDRSKIDRIMAKMQADLDQKAHYAEREQATKEHDIEMSMQLRVVEAERKARETEIAAHPPPSISFSGKMPDLGPAGNATILQNAGVEADPKGLAASMSFGKLMDAAEKVMTQKNWNDNLTKEQKQGMAGKKAELPKRPPTAKDQINREKN